MTGGRLGRLLARPLGERERHRLFACVAVVLLLTAAALTLLAPPHEPQPAPPALPAASVPAPAPAMPTRARSGPPAVVVQAGRRFLHDYLAYLYGHARGRSFRAASGTLAASLASHRPRVSPAMRRRHPRLAGLTGHRLAGRSRWVLTATIADGGVARYPVELIIAQRPSGSAVVVGIGED